MSKENKTKEEILDKHEWLPTGGWTKKNMLDAMDEYAKIKPREAAIAMIKFLEESKLAYRKTHEKWEKWVKTGYSEQTLHEFTSEQLADLFLQQTENG
jgi:hypothetical protein